MLNSNTLYLLVLCSLLFACKKHEHTPDTKKPFRTVIVYLAGNNTLAEEAYINMEQMERGINNIDCNLIVYARLPNENPALYRIKPKQGEQGGKEKIKTYDPHNSSNPTIMAQVIADIQELYPAKTYGLILWSHATGWIPSAHGNIKLKSFGDDAGQTMDVQDLHAAIPSNFDFIMFDACSMASVEVLYELKDKTKYFIASPGEVVANGMPYAEITKDLFSQGEKSYIEVAKKYHEYYNKQNGLYRSATVSVVDASKLGALAQASKRTLNAQAPLYSDFNRQQIQRMDFDRTGNPLIAYDYLDFISQNYSSENYNIVRQAIDDAVLFKANTPEFSGIAILKNCGLSAYIPHPDNESSLHIFYRSLKWYKDSGYNQLF